ncbi:MAG: DUF1877 family protein [Saprospiraceae bacterium]
MGMLAHYYQINKEQTDNVLQKICSSSNNFYEVISNREGIQNHLDIDKSWLNLVEVFKDIHVDDLEPNIGEIIFYGNDLNKSYELDGLLNYTDFATVKKINKYLTSIPIENKDDFIKTFNSTQFTRFGEIDYSEYYDYLFLHLGNLKIFYLQCEKEESGVIISIG